ncbi:hypothetical protein [uncultured Amphritea sp.]|uniref:TA system antitoxin ParD family protein n=1 Tax=uncultured Amphritea sp. TaxID=981605 RepID=UPI00263526B7|nr:hypothetical protein [uncultured Amphritea sp.]
MSTANLRLDQELVSNAKIMGEVMSRSAAKQVEHWAKIGRIMEENPDLTYEFVRNSMIAKAEADAGLVEEYQFG